MVRTNTPRLQGARKNTRVPYVSSLFTLPTVVVTVSIIAVVQHSGSSLEGEVFNPVPCLSLKMCIKYTT